MKLNPNPAQPSGEAVPAGARTPQPGRMILPDLSDRSYEDVSRNLTPARLDRILTAADSGDAADQAELAELILEKNHTIADAFSVRCNALLGLEWHIEPGDNTPRAKQAAKDFEQALCSCGRPSGTDSFTDLLADLMKSLISGYAVSEIIWEPGGILAGFGAVNPHDLDFLNSFVPRIRVCNAGQSQELTPGKYLFAQYRMHGPDPVRGGLIRPLAWLHCFIQCNLKDLLAFIERYGMPFVLAKVSDDSFNNERSQLLNMIRNFGSAGGGLVTQGTEIVPVQAPNATGDVYFSVLKFFDDAVHRLLLGQTASSGDGGGLSKDNAQDKVRQDLLESDARYIEDVVNSQLAPVWTAFNCPAGTPAPAIVFDVDPPENLEQEAAVLKTLYEAGFEADEREVSAKFGWKLKKREPDPIGLPGFAGPSGPAEDTAGQIQNLKQKYDALGVAIRAGLLTPTPELEAQTRAELGMPEMSPEVKKAWQETGGVRKPLTIKTPEDAAPSPSGKAPSDLSDRSVRKPAASSIDRWFGPVARLLGELVDNPDPEVQQQIMAKLDSMQTCGDFSGFVRDGEELTCTAIAAGAVAEHDRLKKRMRKRELRSGKQVDGQPAGPADQ